MSRYFDSEEPGDYPSHWWEIDLQRALTSGRGQGILREFETALRSLPERRLAGGAIVEMGMWDDDGEQQPVVAVCAVGAYAAFKSVQQGESWTKAFEALAEHWSGDTNEWDTQRLGQQHGLTRTVAWYLGWLNDEKFGHLKPRQRWRAMLRWVRSEIKSEVTS